MATGFCLICGTSGEVQTAVAACASKETYWTTEGTFTPKYKSFEWKDDVIVWELSICGICLHKGLATYLVLERRKELNNIFVKPLLAIGLIGLSFLVALFAWFLDGSPLTFLLKGAAYSGMIVGVIALIVVLLRVPGALGRLALVKRRSRSVESLTVFTEKEKQAAFYGAAELLLRAWETAPSPNPYLPLPVFKEGHVVDGINVDSGTKKSREILAAASNNQELLGALDPSWKALLTAKDVTAA